MRRCDLRFVARRVRRCRLHRGDRISHRHLRRLLLSLQPHKLGFDMLQPLQLARRRRSRLGRLRRRCRRRVHSALQLRTCLRHSLELLAPLTQLSFQRLRLPKLLGHKALQLLTRRLYCVESTLCLFTSRVRGGQLFFRVDQLRFRRSSDRFALPQLGISAR